MSKARTGRPSKLSNDEWKAIETLVSAGESIRAVARRYGVAESSIRSRGVSAHSAQVRDAAHRLAAAQTALSELPVAHQALALALADELRTVSRNLAVAARLGSATAQTLALQANERAQALVDVDDLRMVSALTRTANEAAVVGLQMLRNNQDQMRDDEAERQDQAQRVTRIEIVPMQPQTRDAQ